MLVLGKLFLLALAIALVFAVPPYNSIGTQWTYRRNSVPPRNQYWTVVEKDGTRGFKTSIYTEEDDCLYYRYFSVNASQTRGNVQWYVYNVVGDPTKCAFNIQWKPPITLWNRAGKLDQSVIASQQIDQTNGIVLNFTMKSSMAYINQVNVPYKTYSTILSTTVEKQYPDRSYAEIYFVDENDGIVKYQDNSYIYELVNYTPAGNAIINITVPPNATSIPTRSSSSASSASILVITLLLVTLGLIFIFT